MREQSDGDLSLIVLLLLHGAISRMGVCSSSSYLADGVLDLAMLSGMGVWITGLAVQKYKYFFQIKLHLYKYFNSVFSCLPVVELLSITVYLGK